MGLKKFEGRTVNAVGIEIRNAAGGLNEAMKIEPVEWSIEQEVVVVMRCTVVKIRHDPLRDADGLRRVHILTAEEATVVDEELVAEVLEDQARRIREANGEYELPIKLLEAHEAGEHQELVEGCPTCDEEVALAAAGD